MKRRGTLWRWLVPRFSLRTLLLLMTVVCLILGSGILRAERQRMACEELERHGWEWLFDRFDGYATSNDEILNEDEPWWLKGFSLEWRKSHGVHYWRSVQFVRDGWSHTPEVFAALAHLPDVRELHVEHCRYPDDRALWPVVGGLHKLEELTLYDTAIDDAGLAHLDRLSELKQIYLSRTIVGDEGIKHLAQLKSLQVLDLDDTNVTDASLPYLAALPQLKQVDLSNTRVTAKAMASLRNDIDVTETSDQGDFHSWIQDEMLSSNELSSSSDARTQLRLDQPLDPFVSSLVIDGDIPLTPERLENLSHVRFVEQLILRGREVGDADLASFNRWPTLFQACFDRTSLGHEGFKWLANRSDLRELIVVGSPVTVEDIEALSVLNELRTLTLRDTRIDAETLSAILSLPMLRDLELTDCPLPLDALLEFGRSDATLDRLALSGIGATPEEFLRCLPAGKFETLAWDGVDVNESVVEWLKGNAPECHTEWLKYVQESARGMYGSHFGPDPPLRDLELRSRFVKDKDITKAMAEWSDFVEFDLAGSEAGSKTMDALALNPHVRFLALAQTRISDHDLRHAKHWTPLRGIDLSGCAVSDAAVAYLEPCWRLEKLWLDKTAISDEAMKSIAKMKRLKFLSLRETKITDAGLRQLEGIGNLETLQLGETQVTYDAVWEFEQRWPKCNVDLLGREVYDAPSFRDN